MLAAFLTLPVLAVGCAAAPSTATPDDVQRIGESFSHACLDYAIADELGRDRTSDDDIRRVLAEQDDVQVTDEQFERVKPALEKMCDDMKPERRRPMAAADLSRSGHTTTRTK